jgi:hypothetical protein
MGQKMKKRYAPIAILLGLLPALLLVNGSVSDRSVLDEGNRMQRTLTMGTGEIVNVDGDVSLSEVQNRRCWNPHSTGLTNASSWTVTFDNETEILLESGPNEAGHVATGAWWTTSFISKEKLPLYTSQPVQVHASFRTNVLTADCKSGLGWLRVALATAVQRLNGSIVYTEMDFWDSPTVLASQSGNIKSGGNIVYKGGDVVEYKMDQATLGEWKYYSVDLTGHINSAWSLKPGDVLESVYVVAEVIGANAVTVKVDDLWITSFD